MFKLILFLCFYNLVIARELPKGIPLCRRSSPEFNSCVKTSTQATIKLLQEEAGSFYDLNERALLIGNFSVKSPDQNGPFVINQDYFNVKMYGTEGVKVLNMKASLTKEKCEIRVKVIQPELFIGCDYTVDGKALIFKLKGFGIGQINATGVVSNSKITCEFYKKDNVEYLRFLNTDTRLADMASINLNFENVFDGNKELSKSINDVLNGNAKSVVDEVSPGLSKATSTVYNNILNLLVKDIPTNKLFLD